MDIFSDDDYSFEEVDSSTAVASPELQEMYDESESESDGYQCEVRIGGNRVYKIFQDNFLATMFEHLTGTDLDIQDRVEAEVASVELEQYGINVPSVIHNYDDTVEMERLDGVHLGELVEDVDDYDSLREIGEVAGSQLSTMRENDYIKLDYVLENIWAETSGLQDESEYCLEETIGNTSLLPSEDEFEVPVFQIDNELVVEEPTKRQVEAAEVLFLSGIMRFDSEKSSALQEGFMEGYGEVNDKVLAMAKARDVLSTPFFNMYEKINGT